MIRLLVCGDREWSKPIPIDVVLAGFAKVYGHHGVFVIHGDARGADSMAAGACERIGIKHQMFEAHWNDYPEHMKWKAGHERNIRMLDEGKPDLVIAFKDELTPALARGGTENCIRQALDRGLPVYQMRKVHG